jgi:hypothetical protein
LAQCIKGRLNRLALLDGMLTGIEGMRHNLIGANLAILDNATAPIDFAIYRGEGASEGE